MENSVSFRPLENRDLDFIYKCKNSESLNRLTVGHIKHFSREDAQNWLNACKCESKNYRYWAICTNDIEKRIIGWISLGNIDNLNKSACFYGILIGDPLFNDGFAWIESYLFIFKYVFEILGFNRLYGRSLIEHKQTQTIGRVMFFQREGIMREAVYKNGKFYDESIGSILKNEYFMHKENNDYELKSILRRFREIRKSLK